MQTRFTTAPLSVLTLGFAASLFSSCGSGSGLIIAASDGGSNDERPSLTALSVSGAKSSPAVLKMTLADPEEDSVDIDITVVRADGSRVPATLKDGSFFREDGQAGNATSSLDNQPTSENGLAVYKLWDFTTDGLNATGIEQVEFDIELDNRNASKADGLLFAIGNEAPQPLIDTAGIDGDSGIIRVPLSVTDPSSTEQLPEEVILRLQFREAGSDDAWTDAVLSGDEDEFAGLDTDADGSVESFFWDSSADSLFEASADVELQVVADEVLPDPDDVALQGIWPGPNDDAFVMRIDNNFDPIAVFENDLLVVNSDSRRGIPVPFSILDEESNTVKVAIQWRREDQPFPPLAGVDAPGEVADLEQLVDLAADDPLRRAAQLATEIPLYYSGTVATLPASADPAREVRLPELASSGGPLVRFGVDGLWLEFLRTNQVPAVAEWSTTPLSAPVDIVPIPESLSVTGDAEALVLDTSGSTWRIVRIDTGSGTQIASTPAWSGSPNAFALSPDAHFAFVALGSGALVRVTLAGSASTIQTTNVSANALQGVDAGSGQVAWATSADKLYRIVYTQGAAAVVASLVDGLDQAHGIVLDPLVPNRAYVALTGLDEVHSVDLLSGETQPLAAVAAPGVGGPPLSNPRALAIEADGRRLFVVTQNAGAARLRALQLHSPYDTVGDQAADPEVLELRLLPNTEAELAAGEFGSLFTVWPAQPRPAMAGGLAQRRRLAEGGFDPLTQIVRIADDQDDLDPIPSSGDSWRVGVPAGAPRSSPSGAKNVFLWDSSDVVGGGRVRLRIVAFDSDIGPASNALATKTVLSALNGNDPWWGLEPDPEVHLDALDIEVVDIDGDGDFDILTCVKGDDVADEDERGTHPSEIGIYHQVAPGVFERVAPFLQNGVELRRPRDIEAADLEGDGDIDLVIANTSASSGERLVIYRQTGPGTNSFVVESVAVASPIGVAVADVTADGVLDIVEAHFSGDRIRIWEYVSDEWVEAESLEPGTDCTGGAPCLDGPRHVLTADFDGDGFLDIASANDTSGNVTVFFFDPGSDAFDPVPTVLDGTQAAGADPIAMERPQHLTAADLNNDGSLDIVVANRNSDNVLYYLHEGGRQFEYGALVAEGNITREAGYVAVADLDEDGRLDVLSANRLGVPRSLMIFFQRTSPEGEIEFRLDERGQFNLPQDAIQPMSIAIEDLDGDGGLDIALGDEFRDLVVYLSDHLGSFQEDQNGLLQDPLLQTRPSSIEIGDFDNDGAKDLVVTNETTKSLTLFRQEAPGVFTSVPETLREEELFLPGSALAVDLNADGLTDIAWANRGTQDDPQTPAEEGTIAVLYQRASNGSSSFQFEDNIRYIGGGSLEENPTRRVNGVRATDLNGDGYNDLVYIATPFDIVDDEEFPFHRLGVFYQNSQSPGDFTFGGFLLEDLQQPLSLRVVDIDRDGLTDILFTSRCTRDVWYLRQSAPGSFQAPQMFGQNTLVEGQQWWPANATIGDMNGDGRLDVLVTSNLQNDNSATCPTAEDVIEERFALAIFYQAEKRHLRRQPGSPDADGRYRRRAHRRTPGRHRRGRRSGHPARQRLPRAGPTPDPPGALRARTETARDLRPRQLPRSHHRRPRRRRRPGRGLPDPASRLRGCRVRKPLNGERHPQG